MDNSFLIYLQRLELIGFFSGYPLLYAVVVFWAGNKQHQNNFISRSASLLSYGYALSGTLYLGLQLKDFFLHFNDMPIQTGQFSFLQVWGLLSVFFWLPALGKRPIFSLLHSLIFFLLPVKNMVLQKISSTPDTGMLRNDMKIYSISLLLNLVCLLLIVSLSFLFKKSKTH